MGYKKPLSVFVVALLMALSYVAGRLSRSRWMVLDWGRSRAYVQLSPSQAASPVPKHSRAALELCAKHTDWRFEDCDAVVAGKVHNGMNKEQVAMVFGCPDSIKNASAGFTWDFWKYRRRSVLLMFDHLDGELFMGPGEEKSPDYAADRDKVNLSCIRK